MQSSTSRLYQYIAGNHLSKKSCFLLLTTAAIAYFLKIDNRATFCMALVSVLFGEYYSLSNDHDPVQNSSERKMGFVESAMHVLDRSAEGGSNVGAIMQVSGEIESYKIKDALTVLMQKHPFLRAKLITSTGLPSIKIHKSADCSVPFDSVKRTSETFSQEYLEKALDIPFYSLLNENSSNLWQITLAKNDDPKGPHEIILKAHHSIFDGTSVGILFQELLKCYNEEKTFNHSLPFLKPSENLIVNQTNWTRFLLNHFYLQIWQAFFGEKTTYREHASQTKFFSERHTKISLHHFEENDVIHLLKACKENQTTLTALMTAALLKATREVLGDLKIETISTPVSMRSYFYENVPKEDHIGCYVANSILKLPINKEMTIWEMAKKYKKALTQSMPIIFPADFNPSKWKLKIMEHEILNDQSHFSQGVSVSNLGKINFIPAQNKEVNLKLLSLHFCTSRRSGDKTIQLYAMTAGGSLNLCFAHAEPLLQKTQSKYIKDKTLLYLIDIIRNQKQTKEIKNNLVYG